MLVLILACLGGVLTILNPCILPVLPFVFARSDRPFMRNGLPMLLGMAITVATLAALGGGWAVHANQYGRIIALVVLAFLGLTLLSTHLALGPGSDGKPVRFRVTIDGKAPGADHGNGIVTEQRLYQLVRQANGSGERLFEIAFLDPGVQAYAFTFG